MDSFTPYASLAGGALIGLSAALLLLLNGKIAGISGIVGELVTPPSRGDRSWRLAFLVGLLGTGLVASFFLSDHLANEVVPSDGVLIAAGLLVGFGTRLGNGCTSGHGVCGIGRLSARSLIATVTFLATAMLTVFAMGLAGRGA